MRRDQPWVAGELAARTGAVSRATDDDESPLTAWGLRGERAHGGRGRRRGSWAESRVPEALAALGFARADVLQAGLLSNPVFSILFPLGAKQLEFALKLPAEALLLRPKRLDVARLEGDRIAERLVQSGLDVVRDVRIGWAEARRAAGRARVAADAASRGQGAE